MVWDPARCLNPRALQPLPAPCCDANDMILFLNVLCNGKPIVSSSLSGKRIGQIVLHSPLQSQIRPSGRAG
jgi:hypothetical protein